MRRAVFLDRDGVLNRAVVRGGRPYAPTSLAEFELLPGVGEAIHSLRAAGFQLVVVTNQPDVATGKISRDVVEQMHQRLRALLPVDDIKVCYHAEKDNCPCRKPKPGLLLEAAEERGIELSGSFMIGDRWRDVAAGKAAGCTTLLIDYGYAEPREPRPDFVVTSLREAVKIILQQCSGAIPAQPAVEPGMPRLNDLRVKIFADGADLKAISDLSGHPLIQGFTTNPTLMRKAGISDYRAFAGSVLKIIGDRPVSFEVFSDEFAEMEEQAAEIASWGRNVYVKIPVTNTRREFSGALIRRLAEAGVQLNITAVLTNQQVNEVLRCLSPEVRSYVSIFAGRIADTGRDPVPLMAEAVKLLQVNPQAELIWASPRELLNIFQADAVGCHVITVTGDILAKLSLVGRDLPEYSLDTVKMFYQDAVSAGFRIPARPLAVPKA